MESWFYGFEVSSELLIDAFVTLWNSFVGIFDATTADTGSPGPHAATALAPAIHALAVEGCFFFVVVFGREENMFGFILEGDALIHGRIKYNII